MTWMDTIFSFIRYMLLALLMYGAFLGLEQLHPAQPRQPLRHILFNLRWYILYALFGFLFKTIDVAYVIKTAQMWFHGPYIHFRAPQNVLETLFGIIMYFLIVDFFYYWFHRLQHHNTFFWELHKFHHSDVSLNVTSTRRVHWLEEPLVVVFIVLPMHLLFYIEPIGLGMLALLEILWLQFIHMNLRLSLGFLGPIIVGPQHHRVHHSIQPQHIDKNFALFFPVWDIMFGTYYRPEKGEYPATGLTTGETYDNLRTAMVWSWRALWRKKGTYSLTGSHAS